MLLSRWAQATDAPAGCSDVGMRRSVCVCVRVRLCGCARTCPWVCVRLCTCMCVWVCVCCVGGACRERRLKRQRVCVCVCVCVCSPGPARVYVCVPCSTHIPECACVWVHVIWTRARANTHTRVRTQTYHTLTHALLVTTGNEKFSRKFKFVQIFTKIFFCTNFVPCALKRILIPRTPLKTMWLRSWFSRLATVY
jgi:hypothetical protein